MKNSTNGGANTKAKKRAVRGTVTIRFQAGEGTKASSIKKWLELTVAEAQDVARDSADAKVTAAAAATTLGAVKVAMDQPAEKPAAVKNTRPSCGQEHENSAV